MLHIITGTRKNYLMTNIFQRIFVDFIINKNRKRLTIMNNNFGNNHLSKIKPVSIVVLIQSILFRNLIIHLERGKNLVK